MGKVLYTSLEEPTRPAWVSHPSLAAFSLQPKFDYPEEMTFCDDGHPLSYGKIRFGADSELKPGQFMPSEKQAYLLAEVLPRLFNKYGEAMIPDRLVDTVGGIASAIRPLLHDSKGNSENYRLLQDINVFERNSGRVPGRSGGVVFSAPFRRCYNNPVTLMIEIRWAHEFREYCRAKRVHEFSLKTPPPQYIS